MKAMAIVDRRKQLGTLIAQGLKDCIAHHMNEQGGTRTTTTKTLVKNLLTAALFSIPKDSSISNQSISNALGTTYHQVSTARERVRIMKENDALVAPYQRATRFDYVRMKVLPSVFDYCLDPFAWISIMIGDTSY